MVSVKAGTNGTARLVGAGRAADQLVPGSRGRRDKRAGKGGKMGLAFHAES